MNKPLPLCGLENDKPKYRRIIPGYICGCCDSRNFNCDWCVMIKVDRPHLKINRAMCAYGCDEINK